MVFQNIFIGRIDDGIFHAAAEKLHRMLHEILVERVFGSDENDERLAARSPDAPGALPGVYNGAGITD